MSTTVILLRTNYMDDRLEAFARKLLAETGHAVHLVADESRSEVEARGLPKLALNADVIKDMKLYQPSDVGWRCGDYGFYLARRQLIDVQYFWMIEPDTRPNWDHYGPLFGMFAAERADFIAPHFREVGKEDFWYPTMRWRSPHVWRCLFGFTRMSARAADLCWRERIRCRWRPDARIMWPNDETFVSTTLVAHGLMGKDLNEVVPGLCTPQSFDFHTPKSGLAFDALERDGLIYHPVLYGDMYQRKVDKIAAISGGSKMTAAQRSERTRLQLLRGWAKLRSGRIPGLS